MSHTKELIEEALDKVEKYLEEKYLSEDLEAAQFAANVKRTGINRFFNKLGIHVIRTREWSLIKQSQQWSPNYFGKLSSFQFLRLANNDPSAFDTTYELLADEQSKRTFDWYVRYRTAHAFIGEEAGRLYASPISYELWERCKQQVNDAAVKAFTVDEFKVEASLETIVGTFVLEQYRYYDMVKPKPGDTVLDIGACIGDTALWFSKLVGPEGRVFAFEPEPSNFKKLLKNIERNRVKNVVPVSAALSDTEGKMTISSSGASSMFSPSGGIPVSATTIDRFVEENKIATVDFIKMDVEGSELNVLRGGTQTIKAWKPKMAVSVYHRGNDLIELPKTLRENNQAYEFF